MTVLTAKQLRETVVSEHTRSPNLLITLSAVYCNDTPYCLQIFEVLVKSGQSSALDRLIALGGNIDADNLGLSEQDQQTVFSNVNYVFHCAATLDFEASLKTTVEINLLGTRRIVELCKKVQHLKVRIKKKVLTIN